MAVTHLLVLFFSWTALSRGQVDGSWRPDTNGYEYYVSALVDETERTWQEARALCMQNGGDLTSVLSENEKNFITTYSSETTTGAGLWIGLNDLDWDDTWLWSDGHSLTTDYWADGNPDRENTGHKCAWQWANGTDGSAPDGKWRNAHCGVRKGFVCKRRAGSDQAVTDPPTQETSGYCPEGFYGVGNKCYKPHYRDFDNGRTWEESLYECRNGPGLLPDLASVHNSQEQALLTSFLQRGEVVGMWIGLSRGSNSDSWRWVDNSQFGFSHWSPGEPGPDEHCAEVWTYLHYPGYWNNLGCEEPRGFICQTFKDPGAIVPTPNPSLFPCPSGYVSYYYACYKVVKTAVKNWADAEADCRKDGTVLASSLDVAENSALWVMAVEIGSPVWLGLNDRDLDGTYEWTDNWKVIYTNWAENEPSREDGGGCVALHVDGTWKDDVCGNVYSYICKSTTYTPATTPENIPGTCPNTRWEEFGSHCYLFEKDEFQSKTWLEADAACFAFHEGSTLASIHSTAENDFIYNHMKDTNPNGHTWIGMYRSAQDNSFKWADFSPVQFENWGEYEPNGQGVDDGGCVRMYTSGDIPGGVWDDHYCDNRAYNQFVCKTPKAPQVTTPTQAPGTCDDRWTPFGAYCYHFRPDDFSTWSQAQDHCRRYFPTSNLASITSDGEDQWIRAQMSEATTLPEKRAYWIGLIKDGSLPEFYWWDGTPFEYDNWGVGEPNDLAGLEKCGEVTIFDTWNDWQCEWALGFVCKMPKCPETGCSNDGAGDGDQQGSSNGLSSGETAGVVIGVLLGLVVLALVAVLALGFFGIISFGPCANKNAPDTRRLA